MGECRLQIEKDFLRGRIRKSIFPLLTASVFGSVLILYGKSESGGIVPYFVYWSACIASFLSGFPMEYSANGEVTLLHPHFLLQVIPSCSGYSYFAILSSFVVWRVLRKFTHQKKYIILSVSLPVTLVIVIIANGMRINAAFQCLIFGGSFISENMKAVVHEWIGIAIFLPVLCIIHILIEKVAENEEN